jgi:hypothetical protein
MRFSPASDVAIAATDMAAPLSMIMKSTPFQNF